MNDDEAVKRGVQFSEDNLRVIEATFGGRAAMAYAGGIACGARNYVIERCGARHGYDLMAGLADTAIFPEAGQAS